MNQKTRFKFLRNNDEGDCVYTAQFPLTDDGCPDSARLLRIDVEVRVNGTFAASITIVSPMREKLIFSEAEAASMEAVADLLYGAARLVTVRTIQPV